MFTSSVSSSCLMVVSFTVVSQSLAPSHRCFSPLLPSSCCFWSSRGTPSGVGLRMARLWLNLNQSLLGLKTRLKWKTKGLQSERLKSKGKLKQAQEVAGA